MDDKSFQDTLNDLIGRISNLRCEQDAHTRQSAGQAGCEDVVGHAVTAIRESIDQLRLNIKYLVFDLEATRRENAYLRKLLNAQNDAE
ncbi:MAG: hypothetical protein KAS72_10525 [Phycisphaerales bacterium]|nr:hypothetical protein [Phycisphaerales bacterium]